MSTTTTSSTTSPDGTPTATGSGTFLLGGDLPITRLGFGAMRITGPGIWGPPADPAEARAVLRRAVELGVNFIDTADSYGPHVSEELIAEALHPYPEGLVIATKGGLTRQGPNRWAPVARPAYLRQQVEMSLRRLKLERIDLYQLHRIDPATPVEESLGELRALQQEGKIRHIGLSEVSVAELAHARTLVPIVSVQNRYNLAYRTAEDVLDYSDREGIGFIPWNPVDTGRLALPGSVLDAAAKHHSASPAQLALAWLLRRSPVILPIPGTSSVAHLEENITAAGVELTDDEFADLSRLAAS
ncbi:putative oxidoreductase, aryl-alcohol dehydrogenase like protein [Frankia torreyi]|uniref:Putative oxidoreductase, aryl-alcohol dehydrogenase like protein n=1 Tax=Frankia torreyi TaxID=1856 RepID=A0A0D8BMT2_9ACTN|nr:MULTISPECIES: aldo/keto reductase [Frankia]KJE25405.1 putative oxidoreductase, aryl-alcohol dehydrogenase like protein [Frankia torreyi]